MAGIVASTLRRKAFHKRAQDTKYQAIEPGHATVSPTDSRSTSRSSSLTKFENRSSLRTPKGAQLCHHDFWPSCINSTEADISQVQFETFDTLVPKANAWLQENLNVYLIKCETIERKITTVDEVGSDRVMFTPKDRKAVYVKGLRLWFVYYTSSSKTGNFVNTIPTEIGYMNIIPRCLDCSGKYPIYENLPETYAAINAYLSTSPLEGKILTIETVVLKLPKKHWQGPDVKPDQTCFPDDYLRHILYITRIYFCYGAPEAELIGAQDFLPDFERPYQWFSVYKNRPKYSPMITAMTKAREWIHSVRRPRVTNISTQGMKAADLLLEIFRSHISVTNVQTLEAVYRHRPGNVHTGVNFVEKSECCTMVRFVRVTYVRPADDSNENQLMYAAPSGFSYKTFIPSPIKVAMCSGAPEYESFGSTWERAKAWLRSVDRRIISVETFYHPLYKVWHCQDGAETSVVQGEWTSTDRSNKHHTERKQLVYLVRVYLDGDYQEPPSHLLPPSPMVEEINDCRCRIM